jgi:hypothetical protein
MCREVGMTDLLESVETQRKYYGYDRAGVYSVARMISSAGSAPSAG